MDRRIPTKKSDMHLRKINKLKELAKTQAPELKVYNINPSMSKSSELIKIHKFILN